jgi:hypothetical protein
LAKLRVTDPRDRQSNAKQHQKHPFPHKMRIKPRRLRQH